ncbi:MAG TPA: hypothetical protein VF846_10900, partial [Thermoanaerobaculia bacterium]
FDGRAARVDWGEWRTGDQKYYVSDSASFRASTGWAPAMNASAGIRALREWLIESGVPALVQQADEHPAAMPAQAARGTASRDLPVAAVPASE